MTRSHQHEPTIAEDNRAELEDAQPHGPLETMLWGGVLLGPVGIFVELQLSYLLVRTACNTGHRSVLAIPAVLGAALAVVGLVLSLREYRRERNDARERVRDRARFMATGGLVLSVFSLLVIAAMSLPKFILGPCEQ